MKNRNVEIRKNNIYISTVSKGFDLLGWNFSRNFSLSLNCSVSKDNIRGHKRKLKNIIKGSYNSNIIDTLKLVNGVITRWTSRYSLSDSWHSTSFELDLFLYKLFWRAVKRYHPRRPNTWIHNKYWKFFSGLWRFTIFDPKKKRNYFLKSHNKLSSGNVNFYRVPKSLGVFYIYNQRKLLFILFRRTKTFFSGISKILYIKQRGLCFICRRPFFFNDFKVVYYSSLQKKKKSNLIITHPFCI